MYLMSSSWTWKSRKAVPQRRSSLHGLLQPGRRCVETSDDVTKDDSTPTPESRILDFSPMPLGAAKTARESAKSPDDPALLPTKRLSPALNEAAP